MNTSNNTQKFYFADLNDSQKQSLADKLLSDHPMRLQNTLVEYVLQKSYEDHEAPFSYEDITNFEYYGSVEIEGSWEELTEDERDLKITELEEKQSDLSDSETDLETWGELEEQIDTLKEMDFDQQPEIYQWFSCSDWLIRKLEEKGQCTLDNEFWGRQCCGQSVVLDRVIQLIAFEYVCDYEKDYLTLDQVEAL